jgi:4'-phosphopantetheinyl transferase EntD
MMASLLPAPVACAEEFGDPPGATLYPEEEALIANAVDKRRREFTTARACARRALARLGLPPAPVVTGERGAPRWPPGVVGSMTHCAGYRAAALAHARHARSIGIDAEVHETLPDGVLPLVARPGEREALRALAAARPGAHWDRLLFSAKESVYKAWFPLTGRWLDFEDAEVTIVPGPGPGPGPGAGPDPDPGLGSGTFHARLLVSGTTADGGALTGFSGRWLVRAGLVMTAVAVGLSEGPPAQGRE